MKISESLVSFLNDVKSETSSYTGFGTKTGYMTKRREMVKTQRHKTVTDGPRRPTGQGGQDGQDGQDGKEQEFCHVRLPLLNLVDWPSRIVYRAVYASLGLIKASSKQLYR